jgi:hypothetical protein
MVKCGVLFEVWTESLNIINTRGAQKVMQHIYFLSPNLLDKNNVLRAVAFKCPAFMHIVARFPTR